MSKLIIKATPGNYFLINIIDDDANLIEAYTTVYNYDLPIIIHDAIENKNIDELIIASKNLEYAEGLKKSLKRQTSTFYKHDPQIKYTVTEWREND